MEPIRIAGNLGYFTDELNSKSSQELSPNWTNFKCWPVTAQSTQHLERLQHHASATSNISTVYNTSNNNTAPRVYIQSMLMSHSSFLTSTKTGCKEFSHQLDVHPRCSYHQASFTGSPPGWHARVGKSSGRACRTVLPWH